VTLIQSTCEFCGFTAIAQAETVSRVEAEHKHRCEERLSGKTRIRQ
jgi:hypothetical protein